MADDYPQLIEKYRKLDRTDPGHMAAYQVLESTYEKVKKYPQSLAVYEEFLRSRPTSEGYVILAEVCVRLGRMKEAVTAYWEALRLQELQKRNRARFSEPPADARERIEALKETIRTNPNEASAYHALGVLLGELNLYEKAVDMLQHAVRLEPNDVETYRLLANFYTRLGLPEDAWLAWKRVVHL